jgi:sulfur carrier protein ThiS
MIDIDEVYKVPYADNAQKNENTNVEDHITSLDLNQTPICTIKNKNYRVRHRHVNQIFIRGDNIVLVTYAD